MGFVRIAVLWVRWRVAEATRICYGELEDGVELAPEVELGVVVEFPKLELEVLAAGWPVTLVLLLSLVWSAAGS